MNDEQQTELERLNRVLAVAKKNGNQLFIQNIEREIAAIQRGDCSPSLRSTSQNQNANRSRAEKSSSSTGRAQ